MTHEAVIQPWLVVLSVFVGKRRVFSPVWPTVHTVFGENGHQKRIISKTVSSMKRFENASHLFSCGRTKTEVSEYDDVILHLPLAQGMLCEGYCRTFII